MKDFIKGLIKLSPVPLTKNHRYDIQTKKIIRSLGSNFNGIDVGCHKGEILDIFLECSPKGKHFGIEALPAMAADLERKYKQVENCKILNFAASNQADEIEFNYVVSNPAYSGMLKRDYDRPHEEDTKIKVLTAKLDDEIPRDLRIDLIKIDVEGAELQVLEGAINLIRSHQPIVVFEFGLGASNHYGTTPEKLFEFFERVNMKISNLGNYLKQAEPLSLEALKRQYQQRENHYFIAHKPNR